MTPNYSLLTPEETQLLREKTPFIAVCDFVDIKEKMRILQDFLETASTIKDICRDIDTVFDIKLFGGHYILNDNGSIGMTTNTFEVDALTVRIFTDLRYTLEHIANVVGLPDLNYRNAHTLRGFVDKISDQILLIEHLFYSDGY